VKNPGIMQAKNRRETRFLNLAYGFQALYDLDACCKAGVTQEW
jgi:hypothetical protein